MNGAVAVRLRFVAGARPAVAPLRRQGPRHQGRSKELFDDSIA
jgi:hypothetical protein